jgi:hypothetical protein
MIFMSFKIWLWICGLSYVLCALWEVKNACYDGKIKKNMRWYELHNCESMYTEHRWCGSTNMYEIMNAEHKTLVERHIGRASVRPMGVQSHGIRNKSLGWSLASNRNQETEQEHA